MKVVTRNSKEAQARLFGVLASSLRLIEPLRWQDAGHDAYDLDVPEEVNDPSEMLVLFVEGYRGSALVRLNGSPYYALDGYHAYVPLPAGKLRIRAEFSPLAAFGEAVGVSPGQPILLGLSRDAYLLYLYLDALLELAGQVEDPEMKKDLMALVSSCLDKAYFKGFSPQQVQVSTSFAKEALGVSLGQMLGMNEGEEVSTEEAAKELVDLAQSAGFKEDEDLSRYSDALRELRKGLTTLRQKYGKRAEVYAVGNAHIDTAWLWPLSETRKKVLRTFSVAASLAEQYEMIFVQSAALYYSWIEQDSPELFQRISELIKKGKWVLAAGWVEPDTNMVSGESLARQMLYSQRFYEREFGRRADVLWLPDSFGFSGNLPQVAVLGGCKLFATHKVFWNDTNPFPHAAFTWIGIDGTPIPSLAFGHGRTGYAGTFQLADFVEQWKNAASAGGPLLYAFGHGDGGGGPTPEMLVRKEVIDELPALPSIRMGLPDVDSVPAEPRKWRGEIYLETHRGVYTSHSLMKLLNARAQEALREAELWSALAGGEQSFEEWWKVLLRNQFHDVLPGSATRQVYEQAYAELSSLVEQASSSAEGWLRRVVGPGKALLVVNSLPWEREGYVEIDEELGPSQLGKQEQGLVAQKESGSKLLVRVAAPALGFAPLRPLSPAVPAVAQERDDALVLENGALSVEVNRVDGRVTITDKKTGRRFSGNKLVLYENIPNWSTDAWDIEESYQEVSFLPKLTEAKLVDGGPLRASIGLTYSFRDSTIREQVALMADERKVELSITPSMRDRELLLKVWFDAGLNAEKATFEIPFGNVERPTVQNTSWDAAKFEVPMLRWADVSEGNFGVAIISEAKHGISFDGSSFGLSVSRTPVWPDPLAEVEEVEAKLEILPHDGDWRAANVQRKAYEFAFPLGVNTGNACEKSFMRVEDDSLLLESLKRSEDGSCIVARLYEAKNNRGNAKVVFPLAEPDLVFRTANLLEDEGSELRAHGKELTLPYKNYEIITLMIPPEAFGLKAQRTTKT